MDLTQLMQTGGRGKMGPAGVNAAQATPAGQMAPGSSRFKKILNQLRQHAATNAHPSANAPIDKRTKLAQQAAGGLVSHALILPILKQVRRSPWRQNSIFSGGIGENTFGPQFDMEIADRMAHSPRMAATQAIANRLLKRNAAPPKPVKTKLDVHG